MSGLFFLSGIVGQFVISIPFTLIFVLVASIFVALGMVPIIATILIKPEKQRLPTSKKTFQEYQEEYFHLSQQWYKKLLGNILLNRGLQNKFLLGLMLALVGSFMLVIFGLVKAELFPQDNQNFVVVSIEKPQGTPLAQTDLATRQVEDILYNEKIVDSFVTTIGAGSALSGGIGGGSGGNTKVANITVILPDKNLRKVTSTDVVNILRKDFSQINDAKITVSQGNNGPSSGSPVAIKLVGDDLDQLTSSAQTAENILDGISGTQDVTTSVKDDGTQLDISIDRAKASKFGLSAASVAQILRASVSGITATTIKKQDLDEDVLVKVDLNENYVNPEDTIKTTLDSIKNLPIITPTGGNILLGSIISTSVSPGRASIAHENEKRIATVSSNLKTGANAVEITNQFKAKIKKDFGGIIGQGVTIDYGGENADVQNTFRDMIFALIALLFLMLAILVLEFNSFRYSFYLLMAIPLSLIGVFCGLAITGQSLSFSAMLKIKMLR